MVGALTCGLLIVLFSYSILGSEKKDSTNVEQVSYNVV
jgi:hypothetical protein